MSKLSSFFVGIFKTEITTITGLGVVGFLAISLSGLIFFSNTDTALAINTGPLLNQIAGIQIVNSNRPMADIQPFENAAEKPVVIPLKQIFVSLKDQTLTYTETTDADGIKIIGQFKISSGVRGMPTPPGEYTILKKKPVVDYTGATYNYPRTKWNLMFKTGTPLNYYIHGAYWHNNFGHPMSHGCINVAYANMEGLYNWADVGTEITIQ